MEEELESESGSASESELVPAMDQALAQEAAAAAAAEEIRILLQY